MMILIVLIMLGLVASSAVNPDPPPKKSNKHLTETDTGRSIELHVGGELEITLSGNMTTGFRWEVSSGNNHMLRLSGEPEVETLSDALGSESKITLHFEAMAAGQTELNLIYHRPFEKDVPPAKTFDVLVKVS